MARFQVTAPTPGFTGVVAGVAFAKSEATIDTSQRADARALAYFRRQAAYKVTALDAPSEEEPEQAEAVKRPGKSGGKAQWVAFAVANGVPHDKADALTAAQLAETIDALIAEAKPAAETQNGGDQP